MPRIEFVKNKTGFDVSPTDAESKSLMELLLEQKIPVASSCGGDGICSKCIVTVTNGHEALANENSKETELKQQHSLTASQRVSCQAKLNSKSESPLVLDTPYW